MISVTLPAAVSAEIAPRVGKLRPGSRSRSQCHGFLCGHSVVAAFPAPYSVDGP